jgi:hypothetical protein
MHKLLTTDNTIPLDVCDLLVDIIMCLIGLSIGSHGDHRYYNSVGGWLKYHTLGTLKRLTGRKLSAKYKARLNATLGLLEPTYVISTKAVFVRSLTEEDIFCEVPHIEEEYEATLFRRILAHVKVISRDVLHITPPLPSVAYRFPNAAQLAASMVQEAFTHTLSPTSVVPTVSGPLEPRGIIEEKVLDQPQVLPRPGPQNLDTSEFLADVPASVYDLEPDLLFAACLAQLDLPLELLSPCPPSPEPLAVPSAPSEDASSTLIGVEYDHGICTDPTCHEHATAQTAAQWNSCLGGHGYSGPEGALCHMCTPSGGVTVSEAVSFANGGVQLEYLGLCRNVASTLRVQAYLDQMFPRTVGKRHNVTYAGKPTPFKTQTFTPVTSQSCLLECFTLACGLTHIDSWKVLFAFSTEDTRPALLTPDSFLSTKHLEILALYFQVNVSLRCPGALLNGHPRHYGVCEGRTLIFDYNGSHFSFDKATQGQGDKAPPTLPTLQQGCTNSDPDFLSLIGELEKVGVVFKDWVPEWPRAEAYVRCLRDGTTGTLRDRFGEDYLKQLENVAEARLTKPPRRLKLAYVQGNPGVGKSSPVGKILAQMRYKRKRAYSVCVPTTELKSDWSLALGLQEKHPDTNKGTPSYFCDTFENSLFHRASLRVVDEIGKNPHGHTALLAALDPLCEFVLILGDSEQTVFHEPKECIMNDTSLYSPECDYYQYFSTEYQVGTHRMCQQVSTFFNMPTTSKDTRSTIHFIDRLQPHIPVLVPARNDKIRIEGVAGNDAITMSSSQGKTLDEIQIVINNTVLTYGDMRTLWTAFSRSRGNVYVLFDCSFTGVDLQKIHGQPILAALYRWKNTVGDRISRPFINIHAKLACYSSYTQSSRRLMLPRSKYLNRSRLDFSSMNLAAPTGGLVLQLDHADPQAFYTQLRASPAMAVSLVDPILTEPLTRAHFPNGSPGFVKEWKDAQVPARIDQEMTGAFSLMSEEKFDGRKLRQDQRVQSVLKRKFGRKTDALVDMSYLLPFHQMRKTDTVAAAAGFKKRVSETTIEENRKNFQVNGQIVGPALWSAACEIFPRLNNKVAFDDQLYDECILENEANRLKVKGKAQLNQFRDRAAPDWDPRFVRFATKNEIKAKSESMFADAKAHQTLITLHDERFHSDGPRARYIVKWILDNLPPWLYLHLGKSPADLHAWARKWWKDHASQANDFEAFDSGQDGAALYIEIKLMETLSFRPEWIEDYKNYKMCLSKVPVGPGMSRGGPTPVLSIARFTGELFTFIFNSFFNICATQARFDIRGIPSCFGGDDSAINALLTERPTWSFIEHRLTLKFKLEITDRPTFCSWRLTCQGIFKDPTLLHMRLMMRIAEGKYSDVVMSYLYEMSFGYKLGEALFPYLDEIEAEHWALLVSFFLRRRQLPLHLLFDGMDAPMNTRPDFYSSSFEKLEEIASSVPIYQITSEFKRVYQTLLSPSYLGSFMTPSAAQDVDDLE